MDKLTVGVVLCSLLGAACERPELGLGQVQGDAGSTHDPSAGGTAGAGLQVDGSGGDRAQDGGSGGKTPSGSGGQKAQGGTGGRTEPVGSGGEALPAPSGGQSGGGQDPIGATGGKQNAAPACADLSESECRSTDGCTPVYGSEDRSSPGTVFAGCRASDLGCVAAFQCAYPEGTPSRCLVFSGCTPPGWQVDAACVTEGCPSGQDAGAGGTGGDDSGQAGAPGDCGSLTICGGRCVDTTSDPANCGECANVCAAGQICQQAVCRCWEALATPEELASTPREDQNLEQLAIGHSDGIVADQAVYDRVVRDVTRIREDNQAVAGIGYWAPNDGKTLLLVVDADTYQAMQAGTYSSWGCLLDSYPVTNISYEAYASLDMYTVLVELRGLYRLAPIAEQFAALPGVNSAEPDSGIGDGPTICLTQGDSVWHYVFDIAGGDCPAGCTTHDYTYFTVSSDGATIERVDTWSTESGSSSAPGWVAQYASAAACK